MSKISKASRIFKLNIQSLVSWHSKSTLFREVVYCVSPYFKFALRQWRVKDAPAEIRAARSELKEEVGGVVEELSLCPCGVEHSQQLSQSPEGVRGKTTFLIPERIHL